jgi:CHASE2 domain-containing sensor protein
MCQSWYVELAHSWPLAIVVVFFIIVVGLVRIVQAHEKSYPDKPITLRDDEEPK